MKPNLCSATLKKPYLFLAWAYTYINIMHGNEKKDYALHVIQCMNKMMMLINMSHMLCRVI